MEKTKSRLNAKSVTNFLSNNAITLLILLMVVAGGILTRARTALIV